MNDEQTPETAKEEQPLECQCDTCVKGRQQLDNDKSQRIHIVKPGRGV